jgi:hypothetical protein
MSCEGKHNSDNREQLGLRRRTKTVRKKKIKTGTEEHEEHSKMEMKTTNENQKLAS